MKCSICKFEGHNKRTCKKTIVHVKSNTLNNDQKVTRKTVYKKTDEEKYNTIKKFFMKKVDTITEKKEVQLHGFSWEKEIITNIYGATPEELKDIKYNSKMDLPAKFNRLDGCDISIKTSCNKNTVCMADCLRVFDTVSSGKPFHMVVVYYTQDDTTNTKNISSIIEVDLTNSCNLLFGSLTRPQIEELVNQVKSVPQKRKPTKEEYKKMYTIRDSLQPLSGAIHLDIKCNSSQSRLQCSFNHFQNFIKKNKNRIIQTSNTNQFRGGVISSQINSSRRVFNKK